MPGLSRLFFFLRGKNGDTYIDPATGKSIEVPEGKTLKSVNPEANTFYKSLGDTKVTGELHNSIGEVTEDTWYQFFIGAITAGLIEAGPTVAKNISNTQAGYGVNKAGKVEELIGHSLELNTKTEAYKLASRLADGIVRMNDYNVGELLRAYVEEGGDMAFMKTMPDAAETNADRIAPIETREAVNQLNMEGLADKVIPKMTQAEIEQSVQESIREKAATAPEALQKTVFDGMSALIAIESRVKAESGNINHKGIGIDSAHYEFMGYLRGETALDTTAWTVAETIKTVMRSETLTEAETEQLAGLLTKIVGDARLSETYVGKSVQAYVDSEKRVEDNTTDNKRNGIVQLEDGFFKIEKWEGYPDGEKPIGPFIILEGEKYDIARNEANYANAQLHRQNPLLKGMQIHEIHPVKFGGSTKELINKTFLTPKEHAKYTVWWNRLLKELKK